MRNSLLRQQFRVTVRYLLLLGTISLVAIVAMFTNFAMQDVVGRGAKIVSEGRGVLTFDDGQPYLYAQQVMEQFHQSEDKPRDEAYFTGFDHITRQMGYRRMLNSLRSVYSEDMAGCAVVATDAEEGLLVVVANALDGDGTDSETGAGALRVGDTIDIPRNVVKDLFEHSDGDVASSFYFLLGQGLFSMSAANFVKGEPSSGSLLVMLRQEDAFRSILFIILAYAAIMFLTLALSTWLLNRRLKRTLIQPLESITAAARSYSSDKELGDWNNRRFAMLDIHTDNEVEQLSHVLAEMEEDLSIYVRNLTQATAENERKDAELRMANQIQQGALPGEFPVREEFEIFASMSPAREVGGDFYDFLLVDDDHLGLVIADVSDKGVPAALFMMTSKAIIASHLSAGRSPADALSRANDLICANNQADMFVTVWIGVLELSTGILTSANAGHEYPAVMQPGGDFELLRRQHGLVAGGMEGIVYQEYKTKLNPGAKLFVYTDGVPEATNADKQLFGLDRMVAALNVSKDATPEEILRNMRLAVDEFVQNADQFDDLTMLCLEYRGCAETQQEERTPDADDR